MKISEKIMNAWAEKRTRGDIRKLIAYTKASKPTIIRAINHGEANENIILKISRYYSEKESPQDIESKALNLFSDAKGRKTY
ncbi:MAG: hypothetical protein ACTHNG_03390 [Ginsengibacter sp.]